MPAPFLTDVARLVPSLLLASLLGFAAHRAGICNVKAVEEVLTTRRATMFASFGKTVLWTMVVTLLLLFLLPETRAAGEGLTIAATSMAGGFLCGATAVQVGTATFWDPQRPLKVAQELGRFLDGEGVASAAELRGALRLSDED